MSFLRKIETFDRVERNIGQIKSLYRRGWTMGRIAKKYDTSDITIIKHLERHKVWSRCNGCGKDTWNRNRLCLECKAIIEACS